MGFVITLGTLRRELLECTIAGSRYPYLPVAGDLELIVEAAQVLAACIPKATQVLLAPEFGGAIVAHQLAVETRLPYIVARKRLTPFFADGVVVPVQSAAGSPGHLFLDGRDAVALRLKAVLLVDEVVLSGGTMIALEALASACGAHVVAKAAIATQGSRKPDVIAPLHLPRLD